MTWNPDNLWLKYDFSGFCNQLKYRVAVINWILLTGKWIVSQFLLHRPGRATKAALAGFATPHCSSPTSRSRPVSRGASDDGAPSFWAEGALKVRVGWRPSSSTPASFCHLVQEDKWTFDANTRPIFLKTKMFAPRSAAFLSLGYSQVDCRTVKA